MKKNTHLFTANPNCQLEFSTYGHGIKTVICFHGFGQAPSEFEALAAQLPDYQIIGISLFFHGSSDRWEDSKYLEHTEWQKIFGGMLNQLKITKFSLLGYSMGGRYVISSLYAFSDRVQHCFLIAPDGVVKRGSYELATFPYGMQQLFKFFMRNPSPFFTFLNVVEKTRIVDPWTIKFSRSQLKDPRQREMVLKSWITLKRLRLKQNELVSLINKPSFSSVFIFGKHDRIIQPKRHFHFLNKLQNTKVFILDTGHAKLLHASFSKIAELLN